MIEKLQIKEIEKSFYKEKERYTVIENVSFDVSAGEILCILGPTGCGKSTILRLIAGFEKVDFGSILLNGKEITKPDANRVMVFQDFNQLLPWKTVLDNIIYPLEVNKIGNSKKERNDIAQKYLDLVELTGFDNNYPHQLSGGMKQKAAIARSLTLNPEILLMDEPFGSLDAQSRIALQNMLIKVWFETKVTIVFVTHDIQEAILLSDRILVMGKNEKGIKKVINNTLDKPRIPGDTRFGELWREIYSLL